MENTLKRLLSAESSAERTVAKAHIDREQRIQQALHEAHIMEENFKKRIPKIHEDFLKKSELHAEQTRAELEKRYEEKKSYLRDLAEENQERALESAINLMMRVGQSQ